MNSQAQIHLIFHQDWFIPHLASTLPLTDIAALSRTCKKINAGLRLQAVKVRNNVKSSGDWFHRDNEWHPWFDFDMGSISHYSSVHSVVVQGVIRDQQWGNRKGHMGLFHLNNRSSKTKETQKPQILQDVYLRPHRAQYFRFTVPYGEGSSYRVSFKVGDGGGHSFHARAVEVYAIAVGSVEENEELAVVGISQKEYLLGSMTDFVNERIRYGW
mmetsp:Transcript_25344/g.58516  ORF Transcript_25344/g.58516 Transcript_25344/m.58516 type:complete len:214 (-) Transcript_25344:190-831(-)|eukprot:CAMPEP_0113314146 /NCGR_PEP_ID=MMETSP0010_2-20120614/10315_1 /TAXON_ID=216773 ORGANISM="Corethron hystrix, Strain 308" /NCGR_SAMPLE_ID=MMETSP0010_2 /ASSEMBLY_ACC=CAM_ASM_000155 /LENGTH=213 /DNA_ID=CAMNT_0000170357 /DNA_START=87 /DNA_END=728 /DNA_ORIENTATION=- /assembly_acc=CAM_ASM_000155